jgi:hypothetical protein
MSHYEQDKACTILPLYEWVDTCMEIDRWDAVKAYFSYYFTIPSAALTNEGVRPQTYKDRKCSLGEILLRDVIEQAVYRKNLTFLELLLDFSDRYKM